MIDINLNEHPQFMITSTSPVMMIGLGLVSSGKPNNNHPQYHHKWVVKNIPKWFQIVGLVLGRPHEVINQLPFLWTIIEVYNNGKSYQVIHKNNISGVLDF